MNYAAILAGGSGTRMGSALPKQFLPLGGKPVLVHTAEKFINCKEITGICIVCPAGYISVTREVIEKYFPGEKRIFIAAGGENRNASLIAALDCIREHFGAQDSDIVLTHDAVRPFINERIITENIQAAAEYGAANTVIESSDSIILTEDGSFMTGTVQRTCLRRCQTPQTFVLGGIYSEIMTMTEAEAEHFTDAASFLLSRGKKIALVRGDEKNIKLTCPGDMLIAGAYLENM